MNTVILSLSCATLPAESAPIIPMTAALAKVIFNAFLHLLNVRI